MVSKANAGIRTYAVWGLAHVKNRWRLSGLICDVQIFKGNDNGNDNGNGNDNDNGNDGNDNGCAKGSIQECRMLSAFDL